MPDCACGGSHEKPIAVTCCVQILIEPEKQPELSGDRRQRGPQAAVRSNRSEHKWQ